MAENVKLASFDLDLDDVIKSAMELKKSIDEIKEAQKEARKEGKTATASYVENEASLKALNSEYRLHIKAMTDTIQSTADAANRQDILTTALNTEATTIAGLREQNKLLNKLRNEANLETAEGREELKLLNAQLDANNDKIKENVDSLSQQKINVGNYSDSIKDAIGNMNPFNQSLGDIVSGSQEAGGALNYFGGSVKQATTAVVGLTRASIAFIATPIGAIIAAIGLAIGLVANAMSRSEDATTKMSKAFSIFGGSINGVMKLLQPLGEYLIDGIVRGMELAEAAAKQTIATLVSLLEAVGWDSAAESVKGYAAAVFEAAEGARELTQAEADLEKAQRKSRLVQLEYQTEAEKLRQIRDNTNLSIRERIQANEQLSSVLKEQQQEELRLAQIALKVANLRIEQEGRTGEALDAQYEALTAIADINERINSQESEQLTNRASLLKEASDLALQRQKDALDLFLAEQGERARTLQEELDLEEKASIKRREILKSELDAKKISNDAYNAQLLRIDQDLARRRAEIASDNAMREVEAQRQSIELRRENEGFLSAELAQLKQDENNRLLIKEQELAALRLQQGLINQQEFDDAVRELKEANRIANAEIDTERENVEREESLELQAIRFENQLARMEEQGATAFELEQQRIDQQRQIEKQKADQDLADGLISQELYNARIGQINDQADRAELANEEALANQKLAITQNTLGAISALIGKESAAGKAVAIAQALINTYKGITAALAAPFPLSIPAVATAAATGFKAVKDIVSTDPMGESETVSGDLQRTAQPTGGASSVAASGNAVVQQQIENSANQAGLTDGVTQAVREGARLGTQQGSQEGITNLSDNKAIQNSSTI